VALVPATTSASGASRLSEAVGRLDGQHRSIKFTEFKRRFVPGQVIVRFHSSATQGQRERAVDALDAHMAERLPLPRTQLLDLGPGEGVRDAVALLEDRQDVAFAQPNFIRGAQAIPNDPSFSSLWGLDNQGQAVNGTSGTPDADIDATAAWDTVTGDAQTVVAVVDTGIDYTHDDLQDNLWSNPDETPDNGIDDDGNGEIDDVLGWDFVDSDNSPLDENGHGTHVAGTIGAQGNNGIGTTGVAWDASLIPVRVLDAGGSGTDADVAAAFVYAAQQGADVVNASLGGPGASPILSDAVTSNAGTLYVVAAGNDGTNNDSSPEFPCNISALNLICVAASNQNDGLAGFSNYGASSVDLAAPGTNIYSTYPGSASYTFASGTSMATPHVSGAAALLYSAEPSASVADIRSTVLGGVDAKPSLSGRVASGGRLNVNAALRMLVPQVPETTITSGPVGPTNDTTPNFAFSADQPESSFECRVDDGAFAPCSGGSSHVTGPLSDGPHTFEVRASNSVGTDPTPAAQAFTVDTDPPESSITSGPTQGETVGRRPLFRFSSDEVDSDFNCRVDSGGWQSCSSPRRLGPLRGGSHTFRVAAVDAATNPDPSPAQRTFSVDARPPNTRIIRHPKKRSRDRTPRFWFRSGDRTASFDCRIDSRRWRACNSPKSYRLGRRKHKFKVRAEDRFGNRDATPATYRFRIFRREGITIEAGRYNITELGRFHPNRNASLKRAIRAFGRPSSRPSNPNANLCKVGWRHERLQIEFANYGGHSACSSRYGRAQSVKIGRFRKWRTSKDLWVGQSTRRLRSLYPRAERHGALWWLKEAYSPFGTGSWYPVLAARARNGRVVGFAGWIGAAGE
jgi:subtilisin family serine protease